MTGYNHYPNCLCGWCKSPEQYSTRENGLSVHAQLVSLSSSLPPVAELFGESKSRTQKRSCWWCSQKVFYHTNGHGDSVLFDNLGLPWRIHECWEKYSQQKRDSIKTREEAQDRIDIPLPSLYFQKKLHLLAQEDGSQDFSNEIRGLLFGIARLLPGARVGSLAVSDILEIDLASTMNLTLAAFRFNYQKFYTCYEDGTVSVQSASLSDQVLNVGSLSLPDKSQLLCRSLRLTEGVRDVQGMLYLKENLLAKSVGLTLKELRHMFKGAYKAPVRRGGKVSVPLEYSEHALEHSKRTLKMIRGSNGLEKRAFNLAILPSSKKSERSRKKNIKLAREVRPLTPKKQKQSGGPKKTPSKVKRKRSGLMACPFCESYWSSNQDKINQHIKKKHGSSIS